MKLRLIQTNEEILHALNDAHELIDNNNRWIDDLYSGKIIWYDFDFDEICHLSEHSYIRRVAILTSNLNYYLETKDQLNAGKYKIEGRYYNVDFNIVYYCVSISILTVAQEWDYISIFNNFIHTPCQTVCIDKCCSVCGKPNPESKTWGNLIRHINGRFENCALSLTPYRMNILHEQIEKNNSTSIVYAIPGYDNVPGGYKCSTVYVESRYTVNNGMLRVLDPILSITVPTFNMAM